MTREQQVEKLEALVAGILSAIKSTEDFMAQYPRQDFREVEAQLDDAYDRCMDLSIAAGRVKRNEEFNTEFARSRAMNGGV